MDAAQVLAQQSEIARRRKLLDVLAQQNMATPITGGGRWNAIGQALAKLGSAAIQGIGNKQLADSEETNRGAYSNLLRQEMDSYLDTSQGKAGVPLEGPTRPDESSWLQQPVKANPREAVVRAMTSQLPEMQALGKAGFGALAKEKPALDMGELLKNPDINPQAKVRLAQALASGDQNAVAAAVQGLTGRRDIKESNSQFFEFGETGGPVRAGDARTKFDQPGVVAQGPQGPIIGQRAQETGEVDFAPQGTTIQVGSGERAASTALGGQVPEVLKTARDAVVAAQEARSTSTRILQLIKDPKTIAGIAATPGGFFAGLGAAMGLQGPEAASQTQELISQLAKGTLAASAGLKGAISDKDILFLRDAAQGKIQNTPEAIANLASIALAGAHNTEILARQQWRGATSVPGAEQGATMFPLPSYGEMSLPEGQNFKDMPDGRIRYLGRAPGVATRAPEPAKPVRPGEQVMSVDEWLKSQGGG